MDNLRKAIKYVPLFHIWNYDETNLCDDPGYKRVIYKRGTVYVKISTTSVRVRHL